MQSKTISRKEKRNGSGYILMKFIFVGFSSIFKFILSEILKARRMKYSVSELQDENVFRLVKVLSLEDMVQFVFRQMKNHNVTNVVFYAFAFCSFVWMVWTFFFTLLPGQWNWTRIMLHCFYGFILWPIMLIPVHEIIHAASYKLAGASQIKFGIKPEYYLFYVTTDKYVIGKTRFMMVAFTPFVTISIVLILLIFNTGYPLSWSFITSFFVHTTMCIGDFAIAGFFMDFPDQEMYTYDDTEREETYFYVKKRS